MKESSTLYHTIICWLILEWWVGEENEQEEKYYEDLRMKKDIMGLHLNKLESEIMNDYTSEDNEEVDDSKMKNWP